MENLKELKIYSAPASYTPGTEKVYFKVISNTEKLFYDSYFLVIDTNDIDYVIEPVIAQYTGEIIDITGVTILSPDPSTCDLRYSKVPITPVTTVYSKPAFYKYPGIYKIYFKITAPDSSIVIGFYVLRIMGIQVDGSVVDAVTGLGLQNAIIVFKIKGTSEEVKSLLTDSLGEFSDDFVSNETLTAHITCNGYYSVYYEFNIAETSLVLEPFVLVPDRGDVITIVLTWGATPADLDSYLQRKATEEKPDFVIYFRNKTYYEGGKLIAELDLDKITGYGPETTSIYDYTGEYEFYVMDYYSTTSPANATAKIYLPYNPTPIVVTCDKVIGSKKWDVCSIVDGVVTVINEIN